MNKPESKPAQSLEEILASIRKALAEEEVQGVAERPSLPETAFETDEEPVPTAAKGDALSGRLAVALNGSGGRDAAPDDDIADLLAPVPSRAANAPPAERPVPAKSDAQDPLWFLARKPDGGGSDAAPDGQAHAPVGDGDKASSEEPSLSRPETLRPSLPPLFGAQEGAGLKAEPINFTPSSGLKSSEGGETAVPKKAKDEAGEARAFLPEAAVAPQPVSPQRSSGAPGANLGQPPRAAAPAAPAADAAPSAPTVPRTGPAGGASPPLVQARALEETIGQLLEPVIRNWLESNLPRLVEKVVREEVARAAAAKSDAVQG